MNEESIKILIIALGMTIFISLLGWFALWSSGKSAQRVHETFSEAFDESGKK